MRLTRREADEASIFHVEYRIEPIETGMRFAEVSEFEWQTLPGVLQGTIARAVRRGGHLRALKLLLQG